ncbi:MAG: Zn-dependent hydrolase [Gorillibacterium sp.]|nr:Zn-dependent hydrolase [Gorillibacterium sp.]
MINNEGQHLQPDVARVRADIEALSTFVDESKTGWTRRPFTVWYDHSRSWLAQRMEEAGLQIRRDAASNLIGLLPGSDASLPPIMIGSHTDTVNGGGRFDGIIGVVAGIEIVRLLQEQQITLKHSLEIVDFTAEEPSEFGISTIGSRGMVGNLPDDMLERTDPDGIKLRDALARQGGKPELLALQARKPSDVALYLELHIEQGPVLEQSGTKLGVVLGIVGIRRFRVTLTGTSNHAGTTPMTMRSDALAGFCEIGLAFERHARQHYAAAAVGTIGRLTNKPNASNVVPGRVVFDLEIRSLDASVSAEIYAGFAEEATRIAHDRGLAIDLEPLSTSAAIQVEPVVRDLLQQACASVASTISLPSGAGHDANQLAAVGPIGMIFVPSRGGRSHCPEEWTDYPDVALGIEALAQAVLSFDLKEKR